MTARQEFIDSAILEAYRRHIANQPVDNFDVFCEEFGSDLYGNDWSTKATDKQFRRAVDEINRGVEKKLSAKADRWAWKNA